jgi:ribose 5-phosphate isomerase
MSKFLKLLEQHEPTDEVHQDPNDALIMAIEKLCSALKIPCEKTDNGLMIKNLPDEEAEDPTKMASALTAVMSIPDQKGIFKSAAAKQINVAKENIARGISNWAGKWVASLNNPTPPPAP